jgi:signal transduction histidine kinase
MYSETCDKHICVIGRLLLNESAPFRERLQAAAEYLAKNFKIAKCSVMLVTTDDLALEVVAATNHGIIGLQRKLSDVSIATMALMEGSPFYSDGKRRSYFSPLERSDYSSEFSLSIPVSHLDKKLGVINFTDSEDGTPFTADNEKALTEIVQHIAPFLYAAFTNELCRINFRKIEEKNDQLQQLDELKTNLTGFIVHDLKGPISTIIGNLDMLSYEPLTEQQMEYLGIAIEDTFKMQRMVLNILDVLKLEDSKIKILREETDIYRLAEREVASFRSVLARNNMSVALEGQEHVCYVDENLVARIISNLLLNAIEHAPEGTQINIAVRYDAARQETALIVSDQGSGIPDGLKEKIFDKFFQAAEGRTQRKTTTGLGLTFCKLVAEAHGGTIRAEDSETGGARFIVTFPEKLST